MQLFSSASAVAPVPPAGVKLSKQQLAHQFALFLTATTASDVQGAFDTVIAGIGISRVTGAFNVLEWMKSLELLKPNLPHRPRQLLNILGDWRQSHSSSTQRGTPLQIVIMGAGPIGLRTAIELAALGADVEVFESRDGFTRLQVVHLWEMVEQDLIEMGVKMIDPVRQHRLRSNTLPIAQRLRGPEVLRRPASLASTLRI